MRNFISGFILGALLFGGAVGYAAFDAKIVGSGVLDGVEVMKDSELVCSDPHYYSNTRVIECE